MGKQHRCQAARIFTKRRRPRNVKVSARRGLLQGELYSHCSLSFRFFLKKKLIALKDTKEKLKSKFITLNDPLSLREQLDYKVVLLMGLDRLDTQLVKLLASNSVVMKEPTPYGEWFEHKLENGKHWIVPDDFASSITFNLDRIRE